MSPYAQTTLSPYSGIDELQKFARKLCSHASLSALAFRKVNGAIESKLARVPDAFAPTSP